MPFWTQTRLKHQHFTGNQTQCHHFYVIYTVLILIIVHQQKYPFICDTIYKTWNYIFGNDILSVGI